VVGRDTLAEPASRDGRSIHRFLWRASRDPLEVAGLDGFAVVLVGAALCIGQQLVDFLVESFVEVGGDVHLVERFLDSRFDDKICDTGVGSTRE
jgi:hypothetical protein